MDEEIEKNVAAYTQMHADLCERIKRMSSYPSDETWAELNRISERLGYWTLCQRLGYRIKEPK